MIYNVCLRALGLLFSGNWIEKGCFRSLWSAGCMLMPGVTMEATC